MSHLTLSTAQPAKPCLLMLSHCVPSWRPHRGDEAGRKRAWQLLSGVSATHDVYLACLADGPVSLEQWRDLSNRVKQTVIAPVNRFLRLMAGVGQMLGDDTPRRWMIDRSFGEPVRQWFSRVEFTTALHTSASLLHATHKAAAVQRVVDVPSLAALKRGELAGADRVIVRSEADAARARTIGLRAMVLPPAATELTLTAAEQPAFEAASLRKAA